MNYDNTDVLQLRTPEEVALATAISNGHSNPRDDEKQNETLWAGGANRKILEYKKIHPNEIITNNIRFEDVDTVYCREHLHPLIQRYLLQNPMSCGLEYPLMVVKRGAKYECIHGHNRFYCLLHREKATEIPVFVIENSGTARQKLIGKVKPNTKRKGRARDLKMEDVVAELHELKSIGEFTDLSDRDLTFSQFESWMDEVHENEFTSISTRGKIFKSFFANASGVKTSKITLDKAFIDSFLSRNGYPSRWIETVRGKFKETKFPDYVCDKKKAIILFGQDNEQVFQMHFWNFVSRWVSDEDYRNAYSKYSIHFMPFVRYSKLPATVPEIQKIRKGYMDKINLWNQILANMNAPLISKFIGAKQLTIEKTDQTFLPNKDGEFE